MIRFFDIVLAGFALAILAPLLIPIFILLKLTGEGEVFYLQQRVGRDEKIFSVIKFATMLRDSANMRGATITRANDPRILPFGHFLRYTKINELPQLINVLRGDMSLIGPRPLTTENFCFYDQNVQKIISKVRPGLSGIGSIVFRDEEIMLHGQTDVKDFYKHTIAPYKGNIEVWFVQNSNLWLYFKLIKLTVGIVLRTQKTTIFNEIPLLPTPDQQLMELLQKNK